MSADPAQPVVLAHGHVNQALRGLIGPVHQKPRPDHAVTQARWLSVAGRALDTLTASGQLFALALIKDMVHEARVERGISAELHFVSIPSNAPSGTTKEMFDADYMLQLEDLGRSMGADLSSWQAEVPSAYTVEGSWADAD